MAVGIPHRSSVQFPRCTGLDGVGVGTTQEGTISEQWGGWEGVVWCGVVWCGVVWCGVCPWGGGEAEGVYIYIYIYIVERLTEIVSQR